MLLKALRKVPGLTVGLMDYRPMTTARQREISVEDFPFVKRNAYVHEQEVRVLWQSDRKKRSSLNIEIPLGCISRITLSPWLPKSLVSTTKRMIQSIEGCNEIEVVRSTIIASEEWKNIARNVA
jgi:hypothetical protein